MLHPCLYAPLCHVPWVCAVQVCYYRDKNSINKFQLAKVTAEGVTISGKQWAGWCVSHPWGLGFVEKSPALSLSFTYAAYTLACSSSPHRYTGVSGGGDGAHHRGRL